MYESCGQNQNFFGATPHIIISINISRSERGQVVIPLVCGRKSKYEVFKCFSAGEHK